jgi:hypothetical protein
MPDGGWQWAPSLADHPGLAAAAPAPRDHRTHMPGPYPFDGIGQGWHLEKIWRGSRNTFLGYSAAIYVVEPDLAALAALLHLNDWRDLLADDAMFWFLGESAVERFQAQLLADDNLPVPVVLYREPLIPDRPADRAARIDAGIRQVIGSIDARYTDTLAQWKTVEEQRDTAYWSERIRATWIRRERPLRVLAAVSTHTTFIQYSMRDALHALEQLGCQTRLLTDPRPYEKISVAAYHAAVREFDPDVLLSIDHLRNPKVERIPRDLPQITWDQDNLPPIKISWPF